MSSRHAKDNLSDLNRIISSLTARYLSGIDILHSLVALSNFCKENDEGKDYLRKYGGLEVLFNLLHTNICSGNSTVKDIFLILADLVTNNEKNKHHLTQDHVFTLLRTIFSTSEQSVSILQTALHFFSCLTANNRNAQDLARESHCIQLMVDMFVGLTPEKPTDSESWAKLIEEKPCIIWQCITSALNVCVNNPLNDENQVICSCALPHAVAVVRNVQEFEVVNCVANFVGFVVASNCENQDRLANSDGLKVLFHYVVKKQLLDVENSAQLAIAVESVVRTLNLAVKDNGHNMSEMATLGLIICILPYLKSSVRTSLKLQVAFILTLCVEQNKECRRQFLTYNGKDVVTKLMMETTDEELYRVLEYLANVVKLDSGYEFSLSVKQTPRGTNTFPSYRVASSRGNSGSLNSSISTAYLLKQTPSQIPAIDFIRPSEDQCTRTRANQQESLPNPISCHSTVNPNKGQKSTLRGYNSLSPKDTWNPLAVALDSSRHDICNKKASYPCSVSQDEYVSKESTSRRNLKCSHYDTDPKSRFRNEFRSGNQKGSNCNSDTHDQMNRSNSIPKCFHEGATDFETVSQRSSSRNVLCPQPSSQKQSNVPQHSLTQVFPTSQPRARSFLPQHQVSSNGASSCKHVKWSHCNSESVKNSHNKNMCLKQYDSSNNSNFSDWPNAASCVDKHDANFENFSSKQLGPSEPCHSASTRQVDGNVLLPPTFALKMLPRSEFVGDIVDSRNYDNVIGAPSSFGGRLSAISSKSKQLGNDMSSCHERNSDSSTNRSLDSTKSFVAHWNRCLNNILASAQQLTQTFLPEDDEINKESEHQPSSCSVHGDQPSSPLSELAFQRQLQLVKAIRSFPQDNDITSRAAGSTGNSLFEDRCNSSRNGCGSYANAANDSSLMTQNHTQDLTASCAPTVPRGLNWLDDNTTLSHACRKRKASNVQQPCWLHGQQRCDGKHIKTSTYESDSGQSPKSRASSLHVNQPVCVNRHCLTLPTNKKIRHEHASSLNLTSGSSSSSTNAARQCMSSLHLHGSTREMSTASDYTGSKLSHKRHLSAFPSSQGFRTSENVICSPLCTREDDKDLAAHNPSEIISSNLQISADSVNSFRHTTTASDNNTTKDYKGQSFTNSSRKTRKRPELLPEFSYEEKRLAYYENHCRIIRVLPFPCPSEVTPAKGGTYNDCAIKPYGFFPPPQSEGVSTASRTMTLSKACASGQFGQGQKSSYAIQKLKSNPDNVKITSNLRISRALGECDDTTECSLMKDAIATLPIVTPADSPFGCRWPKLQPTATSKAQPKVTSQIKLDKLFWDALSQKMSTLCDQAQLGNEEIPQSMQFTFTTRSKCLPPAEINVNLRGELEEDSGEQQSLNPVQLNVTDNDGDKLKKFQCFGTLRRDPLSKSCSNNISKCSVGSQSVQHQTDRVTSGNWGECLISEECHQNVAAPLCQNDYKSTGCKENSCSMGRQFISEVGNRSRQKCLLVNTDRVCTASLARKSLGTCSENRKKCCQSYSAEPLEGNADEENNSVSRKTKSSQSLGCNVSVIPRQHSSEQYSFPAAISRTQQSDYYPASSRFLKKSSSVHTPKPLQMPGKCTFGRQAQKRISIPRNSGKLPLLPLQMARSSSDSALLDKGNHHCSQTDVRHKFLWNLPVATTSCLQRQGIASSAGKSFHSKGPYRQIPEKQCCCFRSQLLNVDSHYIDLQCSQSDVNTQSISFKSPERVPSSPKQYAEIDMFSAPIQCKLIDELTESLTLTGRTNDLFKDEPCKLLTSPITDTVLLQTLPKSSLLKKFVDGQFDEMQSEQSNDDEPCLRLSLSDNGSQHLQDGEQSFGVQSAVGIQLEQHILLPENELCKSSKSDFVEDHASCKSEVSNSSLFSIVDNSVNSTHCSQETPKIALEVCDTCTVSKNCETLSGNITHDQVAELSASITSAVQTSPARSGFNTKFPSTNLEFILKLEAQQFENWQRLMAQHTKGTNVNSLPLPDKQSGHFSIGSTYQTDAVKDCFSVKPNDKELTVFPEKGDAGMNKDVEASVEEARKDDVRKCFPLPVEDEEQLSNSCDEIQTNLQFMEPSYSNISATGLSSALAVLGETPSAVTEVNKEPSPSKIQISNTQLGYNQMCPESWLCNWSRAKLQHSPGNRDSSHTSFESCHAVEGQSKSSFSVLANMTRALSLDTPDSSLQAVSSISDRTMMAINIKNKDHDYAKDVCFLPEFEDTIDDVTLPSVIAWLGATEVCSQPKLSSPEICSTSTSPLPLSSVHMTVNHGFDNCGISTEKLEFMKPAAVCDETSSLLHEDYCAAGFANPAKPPSKVLLLDVDQPNSSPVQDPIDFDLCKLQKGNRSQPVLDIETRFDSSNTSRGESHPADFANPSASLGKAFLSDLERPNGSPVQSLINIDSRNSTTGNGSQPVLVTEVKFECLNVSHGESCQAKFVKPADSLNQAHLLDLHPSGVSIQDASNIESCILKNGGGSQPVSASTTLHSFVCEKSYPEDSDQPIRDPIDVEYLISTKNDEDTAVVCEEMTYDSSSMCQLNENAVLTDAYVDCNKLCTKSDSPSICSYVTAMTSPNIDISTISQDNNILYCGWQAIPPGSLDGQNLMMQCSKQMNLDTSLSQPSSLSLPVSPQFTSPCMESNFMDTMKNCGINLQKSLCLLNQRIIFNSDSLNRSESSSSSQKLAKTSIPNKECQASSFFAVATDDGKSIADQINNPIDLYISDSEDVIDTKTKDFLSSIAYRPAYDRSSILKQTTEINSLAQATEASALNSGVPICLESRICVHPSDAALDALPALNLSQEGPLSSEQITYSKQLDCAKSLLTSARYQSCSSKGRPQVTSVKDIIIPPNIGNSVITQEGAQYTCGEQKNLEDSSTFQVTDPLATSELSHIDGDNMCCAQSGNTSTVSCWDVEPYVSTITSIQSCDNTKLIISEKSDETKSPLAECFSINFENPSMSCKVGCEMEDDTQNLLTSTGDVGNMNVLPENDRIANDVFSSSLVNVDKPTRVKTPTNLNDHESSDRSREVLCHEQTSGPSVVLEDVNTTLVNSENKPVRNDSCLELLPSSSLKIQNRTFSPRAIGKVNMRLRGLCTEIFVKLKTCGLEIMSGSNHLPQEDGSYPAIFSLNAINANILPTFVYDADMTSKDASVVLCSKGASCSNVVLFRKSLQDENVHNKVMITDHDYAGPSKQTLSSNVTTDMSSSSVLNNSPTPNNSCCSKDTLLLANGSDVHNVHQSVDSHGSFANHVSETESSSIVNENSNNSASQSNKICEPVCPSCPATPADASVQINFATVPHSRGPSKFSPKMNSCTDVGGSSSSSSTCRQGVPSCKKLLKLVKPSFSTRVKNLKEEMKRKTLVKMQRRIAELRWRTRSQRQSYGTPATSRQPFCRLKTKKANRSISRPSPFTKVEDSLLRQGLTKFGFDWSRICKEFEFGYCRTPNQLRNRWRFLVVRDKEPEDTESKETEKE